MGTFKVRDLLEIGDVRGEPSILNERLSNLLDNSSHVRADVESLHAETGVYRLVLQGTLDQPQSPTEPEEPAVDEPPIQADDGVIGEIPLLPAEETPAS